MPKTLYGYSGGMLRVDLSTGKISKEVLDEALVESYVGGTGYAARLLWDELKPGIDPLGPENKLVISTGPLTGTLTPCSGSVEFCFKSPLTNIFGESRAGGRLGPKLKFAGYDFVIIEGKAEEPVYIYINDGEATIKDAAHLWGKTVHETTDILLEETGDPEASVACIGPGGEKLVRFASVMVDYDRAAGRCGGGAVLGSKKVKGIVVNGSGEIPIARPEKFYEAAFEAVQAVRKRAQDRLGKLGTIGGVAVLNAAGALPTRNFQSCYFKGAEKMSGEELANKYLIKRRACFACPIGCGRYVWVPGGPFETPPHEGAEYETADMMGIQAMVDSLEALIKASYMCNNYGVDTISTGNLIAFAMEAFEKGLITERDTGGLKLRWGDPDAVISLVEMISKRVGLGELLAEGVKRASEKLGGRAEDFACHGKGLEIPAHDARGTTKSLAIQYAVGNPRGGCHSEPVWPAIWDFAQTDPGLKEFGLPWPPPSRFAETNVDRALGYKLLIEFGELAGVLGICRFALNAAEDRNLNPKKLSNLASAATGRDFSPLDLLKVSERAYNLKRCFNVREGVGRKDDKLPKRLMEPLATGPTKGQKVEDLDGMLDEFYQVMGWDQATGIPTKAKLEELGLSDVAETLWKS